jgi:ATP-dependent DNA helicase RecG
VKLPRGNRRGIRREALRAWIARRAPDGCARIRRAFFVTVPGAPAHSTTFSTDDFLIIDCVHRGASVPDPLRSRVDHLLELGIVERVGRGRGSRLLLSSRFYRHLGKAGVYTRRRGLDRETNKALLLKHIEDSLVAGARMEELRQVLPALSRSQIQVLLRELVEQGTVHVHGATRAARWYPGPRLPDCNHDRERLQ